MGIEERHDGELLIERNDGIAVVTLNRPDRLNALTRSLATALRETLCELDADNAVRVIVLAGAGRAFSAGADLRAKVTENVDVLRVYYNPLVTSMVNFNTPLVAAINGVTVGAAVSLTLACDLRIASENATFQVPFVKVGLVPDAGATWLLPRAIGSTRAAEMLMLGRAITAQTALTYGLVNEVVADGSAVEKALEYARILANASSTVGTTRRLLHASLFSNFVDQLEAEASAQILAGQGADFAEAKLAFAEKRNPVFR